MPASSAPAAAAGSSLLASILSDDSFRPAEPRSIEETGLTAALIESLILKYVMLIGSSSGRNIAEWLRHAATWMLSVTVAGALFSVNRILNTGSLNNWVKADSQSWDHEIAVITGGSSGIGASVVQQLLEREPGTRVVVIDFCPLESHTQHILDRSFSLRTECH